MLEESPIVLAVRIPSEVQKLRSTIGDDSLQAILDLLPIEGRAKWGWTAQDVDELSFPEGALILVTRRDGEWWSGRDKNGSTGVFPHNYLEILPYPGEVPANFPPSPPSSNKPSLSSRLSSLSIPSPPPSDSPNLQPPLSKTHVARPPPPSSSKKASSSFKLPRWGAKKQPELAVLAPLPPPPSRGYLVASPAGSSPPPPPDYRENPLGPAYKPSFGEWAQEKGEGVASRLPFAVGGGGGGSSSSGGGGAGPSSGGVPGERTSLQKAGDQVGNAALRGSGSRVGLPLSGSLSRSFSDLGKSTSLIREKIDDLPLLRTLTSSSFVPFLRMSDPLTLAARVAHDLKSLVEKGFVSDEVLESTLAALPVQGTAKWGWEAQDADELSFPVDSTILILKREGEWWTGQADDGSTGLFPHNYLTLLPYPTLPSAPPLPTRKPSHLSSSSSNNNNNQQPPAYPTTSNTNPSSLHPKEKCLYSLPPAPTNIGHLASRTSALPPPPSRGMSQQSNEEGGGEEGGPTDYRNQPLRAAYKPSAMDRAKDRGGELRGKLPFGGGGGAKPNVPEEKRGLSKWSSMAGDGASKGAGWAKGGAGSVKKMF